MSKREKEQIQSKIESKIESLSFDKEKDDLEDILVFNKYLTKTKLGEGSFGKVYSGIDTQTTEEVAIKLESKDKGISLLEAEAYNMAYVKGEGIPILYCYGHNLKYNILIMERLGRSLEFLFRKCNGRFSLLTVCLIALQILARLQHIHMNNLVHRDLKPDNFLLGTKNKNKNKIYLIDFGLCFKYIDSSTRQHVKMKTGKSLTGTARYASINALKGFEQSRRDDLESMGYILVYFLKGKLPWQGTRGKTLKEKFSAILAKKIEVDLEDLCKDLPREIKLFFEHCKKLEFTDDPDYVYLNRLIKSIIRREYPDINLEDLNNNVESFQYDWNLLSGKEEELSLDNILINTNININKQKIETQLKSPIQLPNKSRSDNNIVNLANKGKGIQGIQGIQGINNTSAVVVLNQNDQKENVSMNLSKIQKKLDESEIIRRKTTNLSGIIKRKTTANSSKKVTFGKIEIVTEYEDGKRHEEVKQVDTVNPPTAVICKKQKIACNCGIF